MAMVFKLVESAQGRELAVAYRGTTSETLLDNCHAERHPVAARVIEFSTRLTHLCTLTNPVAQPGHRDRNRQRLRDPAAGRTRRARPSSTGDHRLRDRDGDSEMVEPSSSHFDATA
jgi:hypothetical protein